MTLDHGILNVPLAKRGNIDAQLDRYKADMARAEKAEAKAKAAETRELRVKAKALIASDRAKAIVDRLAARGNRSTAEVRSYMKQEAHWNPKLVIRVFAEDAARA